MPDHYVYVIGTETPRGISRPIKVGATSNPDARLATLQTANPARINFVCVFALPDREIAESVERAFHQVLDEHRLTGEWFDIGPIKAVRQLCTVFRLMLDEVTEIPDDRKSAIYLMSGAWHAEQRALEERVRAAWETAA